MNEKFLKNIFLSLFFVGFIAVLTVFLMRDRSVSRTAQSIEVNQEVDFYSAKIQPIFNNRCIACHSCLESPCQLNLQSYEGARRGAIRDYLPHGGLRLTEGKLTRLFEDAQLTQEWRNLGFHDVIGTNEDSVLIQSLILAFESRPHPKDEADKNQFCAKNVSEFSIVENSHIKLAMPYGLPPISSSSLNTIKEWVNAGAKGPADENVEFPPKVLDAKIAWETFLNGQDMKSKHVARYLFEHLFLAHLYIEPESRFFLKLIRSSTTCDQPKIIPTRRPNEAPLFDKWHYCLIKAPGTIVDKTHIPYNFSLEKLNWVKRNFMDINWTPDSILDYTLEVASNPFLAFKSIPESARYKFLLEDAQYHINTFIKGPVCNGTPAVNSIQEQFYTFFIDPDSDLMALNADYSKMVSGLLAMPGKWGSNAKATSTPKENKEIVQIRNQYRQIRGQELEKWRPEGLRLSDIWDGDGINDNAALTIIRHNESARVVKGLSGDLSKTIFVLDYSLFERLVYNLVVNFDVFGNMPHKYLTRVYMDLIRMEAENNFLDFLPQNQRLPIKKSWYEGFLGHQKAAVFDEKQFSPVGTSVKFQDIGNYKLEMVRKIIFERMNEKVRGPVDRINWKALHTVNGKSEEERILSRIVSKTGTFPSRFPEVSLLIVTENNIPKKSYTIVHNRQLANVSLILLEEIRVDPKQDTLMVFPGYHTSYPNQFFKVEKSDLDDMATDVLAIQDQSDYERFLNKYGIDRMDTEIWNIYDFITADFMKIDPLNAGYLDLSRYYLAP
jgi:hypothetical protein